ncbi:DUF1153 domain-containing protein [Thermosulfurimonas dismutans]|uniref:Transposase n=1 Tax=Thermosulfurimonas dismutans TaxID=999894 RepID=A0A179D166_9BACT|nr:DUF1153 domain-containing protein [Thermosulfurimonas dismutans]OAQ19806.1 transposase [Thermosulfurimonas dismutans]
MSSPEPEVKRWTAKRKTQVVLDILKGKTTVAEVARRYDLKPSEIEGWVEEGIRSMENGLRARPRDLREQYEAKLREAYAALGEAQLEIKALKKLQSLLDLDETS